MTNVPLVQILMQQKIQNKAKGFLSLKFTLRFDEFFYVQTGYKRTLKVGKSQKQIFLFTILPKNERKSSALVARAELGKYFVHFLEESRT
jgi:hypothetical protein